MVVGLAMGVLVFVVPVRAIAQGIWTATSTVNAPSGRSVPKAVWTGARMIVWGGFSSRSGYFNTGGIYDPITDTWAATSTLDAPTGRRSHTAVWTGVKMIVWGGWNGSPYFNTGGVYDLTTDSWAATSVANAPTGRVGHTAVWTGSRMIVWGGWDGGAYANTGGIYDPDTDTWAATSTLNAPPGRDSHTAVWTGSRMIVWGGYASSSNTNTGGIYDPASDSWTAMSAANSPAGRRGHTAVWTGSRMIVWGGDGDSLSGLNTGGAYDPITDTWAATSILDAPSGRRSHTAVGTGSRMIVWGGFGAGGSSPLQNTGGVYDPVTGAWAPTSTINAPTGRQSHAAVWAGSRMIVWGGDLGSSSATVNTGGIYDPVGATHFYAVTPCRVADTRDALGPSGGPALGANAQRTFPVSGICGVPSTAIAVAINVTVVDETDGGDLRIYPAGTTMPLASTINFLAGKVRANNAVIPLGTGGQIGVQCDMAPGSSGRAHFLFDVTGYFE